MATFIDGIAASENIDSSGEKLSISGMDISSLAKTGTFNWEHKKDLPAQTVGKILKAQKIFKEEDCQDERQKMFWDKCQVPFVYVMGELFDEYCDSSKHLAGLFRYDHDKKDQNEHDVVGFSIEGAKIEKQGMVITRSIARKCTITESPCNKMAIAEMVSSDQGKGDMDAIFKTEPFTQIKLFKNEPIAFPKDERDLQKHADLLGLPPMNKSIMSRPGALTPPAPGGTLPAKTNNPGHHLGTTSGGQKVFSHAKTHEYTGMSSKDHTEAAGMHHAAAQGAKDAKLGAHHVGQMRMHMQAAGTAERKEARFPKARVAAGTKSRENYFRMNKALDAGSAMAAPGQATQGAALQGESLDSTKQEIWLSPEHKKKKKKDWAERADEEYDKWEKKEEFRSFMAKRMPHLASGEIDAIGRVVALKKAVQQETVLAKFVKKK